MIEFIKNIPPVILFIIGRCIEVIGKVFIGMSAIVYNITATMHVQLNTNTGKKLKEIEKQVTDIMKMYATAANKMATTANNEDNRLSNIIKNNSNITQLGKKKDDDSKS